MGPCDKGASRHFEVFLASGTVPSPDYRSESGDRIVGMDFDNQLFAILPTVAALITHMSAMSTDTSVSESTYSTVSTPEDSSDSRGTSPSKYEANVTNVIRRALAEEVGVEESELDPTIDLSEVGVDSLLALTILGKLREELDMDVPADLFTENPTLHDIEAALGFSLESGSPTPATEPFASTDNIVSSEYVAPTTSFILRGSPRSASKILFLFPDGSGSATSYAPLPDISPDVALIGLNCPYMKNPSDMKCGLEGLTPSYLAEIRRRQPHGPYYFGGWSAGGISALDAAQSLHRAGEKVERLILIDSPNPIGLDKLPPKLFSFFDSINLFSNGDKPPPAWLLPHFLAFIDALDTYKPQPYVRGTAPQTYIIWATDGVCKNPNDPRPELSESDPREMTWLLNNRLDLGSNGWDKLLDAEKVVIQTMPDSNHFTMMAGQNAERLAKFLKQAMA